jgi:hypothetical protein
MRRPPNIEEAASSASAGGGGRRRRPQQPPFERQQQRPQQPPLPQQQPNDGGGLAVEILVPPPGSGTARGRRAISGSRSGGADALVLGLNKQSVDVKLQAGRASGVLNLSCLGLAAVPQEALSPWEHLRPEEKAWEIVETQKVDLSMNALASLPPAIGNWAPSLRVLLCRQNQLGALPRELFSLSSLVTLDLSNNALAAFGGGGAGGGDAGALLEGLPALRELNLKANHLVSLPSSLGVRGQEMGGTGNGRRSIGSMHRTVVN